jgi:pimeloyl-ACP methyl ester carboxylesterase
MASHTGRSAATTRPPEDWPDESERRYATRQADLADHYHLDCESRTVDTDAAGRVHYLVAGEPDGEPVVLLHGITAPAATWVPMFPALADRYRLYVPDMPGEGLSAKPDYRGRDLRQWLVGYLLDLLDELGLDRPDVVGHSLGGGQALLLAIDHDRVDRLCLVGGPVGVSRQFPILVRLLTIRGVSRLLFRAMTYGDPVESARDWFRRFNVVDDAAIPTPFYRLYATRTEIPGLQSSLRSLMLQAGSFGRMIPLTDLRPEMAEIERPTAFVWGTEDYFWSPAVGRPIAERMPVAAFHELSEHGHTPWLEPSDETATRVRSFLDG